MTVCQNNVVLWHSSTLPVQHLSSGEEDMAEFCDEQTQDEQDSSVQLQAYVQLNGPALLGILLLLYCG